MTAVVDPGARPRCSVFIAVSVDGYIARPDGGLDWLAVAELAGEDYGYGAFLDSVDCLVVGRATYDAVLAFDEWPWTGKRCVVLTHRPPPARRDEVFRAGDPAALVAELGRAGARHLYVDGGAVIRQFLAAGLVDDLTLSVIPVVLGTGRPLFAPDLPEQRLVLTGSRSWSSGVVQLGYRRG